MPHRAFQLLWEEKDRQAEVKRVETVTTDWELMKHLGVFYLMFGFFLLMFHEKLLSCNTETGPIKGHNSDPGQPG